MFKEDLSPDTQKDRMTQTILFYKRTSLNVGLITFITRTFLELEGHGIPCQEKLNF